MQTTHMSQDFGQDADWNVVTMKNPSDAPFINGSSVIGTGYQGLTLAVDTSLSPEDQLEVATKFQTVVNEWVALLAERVDAR